MTNQEINEEENVLEGVILDVDYGYGMKYTDMENLYLKLEVQQFDGLQGVQLFNQDTVGKLLLQFRGDYRGELSLKHLKHCRIFMSEEKTNGVPDKVAKLPPSQFPQYSWIANNNWD